MDCPFCDINKEKNRILRSYKHTLVILSNPRLMEGHLLLIPKRHVEKPSELNEEEKQELFNAFIEFQEKILSKISSGCDIRQNYRPFQEQDNLKVNHLHFHLPPREFKDELYYKSQIHEKTIFKKLTEEEKKKFFELFK